MNDEIKFENGGLYFTWDDEKAKINEKKHDISFRMATEVFFDPYAFEYPDDTTDEERWRIIGKTLSFASPVLFVVYTERIKNINQEDTPIYRIISARKANRREVDEYYGL